ncbi:FAD-dependent oxidoreductase [Kribbella antibiotica]|uniref:FAD-dependent oxidoreductase n=1 Tax=Kribbella antibiotica TaxID=190195 RepID=A0A4R4YMF8_9ACTN|nr:FAD-dependent monooxygenase [Kribbella antibiotica]TDD46235.1 FAD-dependent oxidoreductase [Kribbella antibiotica]
MTTTTERQRRALVVGLGISGTSTALALLRAGWTPVLIEKAPQRRSGGYFVGLFGVGKTAAERLGILDALHDRTAYDGHHYDTDRFGEWRAGFGFRDIPGNPWLMVRGDVEQAAFEALPADVEVRYSTVPTTIEQDADGVDVTLTNTADGSTATERFDLVVGADGLRSTVRRLAFGPDERYLHRLNYMIAAFQLPGGLGKLASQDGITLLEPDRSLWVLPFADHAPTLLFGYQTDDIDAEFTEPPAARVRKAFGPEPTGDLLGAALEALEATDELLFDSVEQVHMDHWHSGRVVLVGDSAWCVTLYAGMGVSAGLAGADLLGTMLGRYGDIGRALTEWENQLRPHMGYYQQLGHEQTAVFTPNRKQITVRRLMMRATTMPVASQVLKFIRTHNRSARMKDLDIARV